MAAAGVAVGRTFAGVELGGVDDMVRKASRDG